MFVGTNMGPIWGRQVPGGPQGSPMFAPWYCFLWSIAFVIPYPNRKAMVKITTKITLHWVHQQFVTAVRTLYEFNTTRNTSLQHMFKMDSLWNSRYYEDHTIIWAWCTDWSSALISRVSSVITDTKVGRISACANSNAHGIIQYIPRVMYTVRDWALQRPTDPYFIVLGLVRFIAKGSVALIKYD